MLLKRSCPAVSHTSASTPTHHVSRCMYHCFWRGVAWSMLEQKAATLACMRQGGVPTADHLQLEGAQAASLSCPCLAPVVACTCALSLCVESAVCVSYARAALPGGWTAQICLILAHGSCGGLSCCADEHVCRHSADPVNESLDVCQQTRAGSLEHAAGFTCGPTYRNGAAIRILVAVAIQRQRIRRQLVRLVVIQQEPLHQPGAASRPCEASRQRRESGRAEAGTALHY
jgi:hypothetical protein